MPKELTHWILADRALAGLNDENFTEAGLKAREAFNKVAGISWANAA